jgi:hypothetical protein
VLPSIINGAFVNTSRRDFFKVSLLGSAALLIGSGFSTLVLAKSNRKPLPKFNFLRPSDAEFLLALAPVILRNNYPGILGLKADQRLLFTIDKQITSLSEHSRNQLRRLFDLLTSSTLRYLAGASINDWSTAPIEQIESFLQGWKNSMFSLKRTGYASLGKLLTISWYAQTDNYQQAGYPGPPKTYPPQDET